MVRIICINVKTHDQFRVKEKFFRRNHFIRLAESIKTKTITFLKLDRFLYFYVYSIKFTVLKNIYFNSSLKGGFISEVYICFSKIFRPSEYYTIKIKQKGIMLNYEVVQRYII